MNNSKSLFLTLCASALLIVSSLSACKKDSDNIGDKTPEPCFTLAVDTIRPGEPVTFNNCSKNADAFSWTFGDGLSGLSSEKNPAYTYNNEGTYTVTLTSVNSTAGKTETLTKVVIVKSCKQGYEGANCATLSRTKFIADYQAIEAFQTQTSSDTFDMNIVEETLSDKSLIKINNFGNSGEYVGATVTGNKITIPTQYPVNGIEVKGSGTMTGNKISLVYTVTNGSGVFNVSAVWTKK